VPLADYLKIKTQNAYSEIVEALSIDMPLIQHGSGDVIPFELNRKSTRILAELTANYIFNLVEAAVDSQEILNDGQRAPLPPPPLVPNGKKRKPPLPSEYEWPPSILASNGTKGGTSTKKVAVIKKTKKNTKDYVATGTTDADGNDDTVTSTNDATVKKSSTSNKPITVNNNRFGEEKKRKRRDIDYWDEPLPEPKIKHKPRLLLAASDEGIVYQGVPIGDWVGVAGIDFYEDKIRQAHVTLPAAIGVQCFIFPVCHDKHLYGKILNVQATRRSMEPELTDKVIMDVIRNEGRFDVLRKRTRFSKTLKKGGDTQEEDNEDPEATDSEHEDSITPLWPGLDELLPMHTTMDF